MLVCQRCNQPFVYPVDNTVALQLVKSEEDLDEDLSETQDEDFADDLPERWWVRTISTCWPRLRTS